MKKILVIQTASIGDVILATALLEKLHETLPTARIDFLVKRGMEALFTGHPFIDHLYCWDKSRKIRDIVRLARELRAVSYDTVINLQRFPLTGLLTVLSGAKETRGFDKNPFSRFYSHRFPHHLTSGIHETRRNQYLISDLSGTTPAKPRLYPKEMKDSGEENQEKPMEVYYTISPASLWFTKQFPVEKWVELILRIPATTKLYLLGSKADEALCQQIIERVKQSATLDHSPSLVQLVNLAGKRSLLESSALMQHARMNFTNDSAPMHLASAVNAPVCAIFCSTTPDFGFGPLSDQAHIIQTSDTLPCRPCGLHGHNACPEKHFSCAMNININNLVKHL